MFWRTWHKVKDPLTSEDWFWVNDVMGAAGPDRWMYLEQYYYFKHARDAMLFQLRFSEHTR